MQDHLVKASKFLSFVLRHRPEAIGLQLDEEGWADVDALITAAARNGETLTLPLIRDVVEQNDKKRFAFSEDGRQIRAVQGHSVDVDLRLEPQEPPAQLFHGTATRFLDSIRAQGLIKGSRQHVHLSATEETAVRVGARHGKPVVLTIDTAAMRDARFVFYCSENGVWLTDAVPAEFITFPAQCAVMSEPALSHYSLGATDAEHRRLMNLASHEEDRVVDACRRAGIAAGATAIDLGCGPLGALAALATVVGAGGTVIGVDASGPALARARMLLADRFPQIRFVEADVNRVTARELGIDGADLVYSRLMLLHQADPAATLTQAARLLRGGGAFIAHEASDLPMHAPASEPYVPAMTRVWELVIGAARARGACPDFARNGRAYLEDAGFKVESHRAYAVHYPPEVGFEIPRVALQSLRPTIEQHALATAEEIARLDQELDDAKRRDDVQWVSSPLMFEWLARIRD